MSIINVGLCEGRHPIPVQEYVFPAVINPLDVEGLQETADQFVKLHKDEEIHLYVTGLTIAAMAVVKACIKINASLILYHYDRDSGEYYPQKML